MGSTPAKGSSNKINLGSEARALAISVLLRSPPERRSPLVSLIRVNANSSRRKSVLDLISL